MTSEKALGPGLLSLLGTLVSELRPHRRWQLGVVFGLMLLGAVGELATLGALMPLLAAMADPAGSPVLAFVRPGLVSLGANSPQQILYLLAGIFAVAALASAGLRVVLLWAAQKLIYGIAFDLTTRLYVSTLAQPYPYHTRHNSSEIIASINKVDAVAGGVLTPLMNGAVAIVISVFIVAGLVVIDAGVAVTAGCGFVAVYLLAMLLTRPRLNSNGVIIAQAQGSRVKAMQEGLGGIRDVLLDRSQPVFARAFRDAEAQFRNARAANTFLANVPRYLVEAAGMVLIVIVAAIVSARPGGLAAAIPMLGALALGAQKLLPLVQQIYLGWAAAAGDQQTLIDLVALLRRPIPAGGDATSPLPFRTAIRLQEVGYSYGDDRQPALEAIDLEIEKGARIGIAGKTGSGKSTLMDLLIGLLEPTEGSITIDGVPLSAANRAAWQRNVAHVPQAIFLADASIAENIAFGVPAGAIDHERVRRAAEQAELADVVAPLPMGYETRVGERGIQLSGGQRQRIGIARALYKQANVMVFDEATSALDHDTERAVMAAIERLDPDLTIILIAHRLTTLEACDSVVWLEGGRLRSSGVSEQSGRVPEVRI